MIAGDPPQYDVVVVGARCAGAATARLLAARGLHVAVLDRTAPDHDPLSTHGIVRGGVVQLSRWGLLDRVLASGAPPVREVTFGTPDDERTLPVKERAGVDLMVAPRRRVLDALLVDAAIAAGADVRTDVSVTSLLRDGDRVTGVVGRTRSGREVVVRARHVVGADGLRSTVARCVEAPTTAAFSADLGVYYAYVAGAPWRGFEFHVSEDAFSGVFPTHDDAGCLWVIRPWQRLDRMRAVAGPRRGQALLQELDVAAPFLAARAHQGAVVSNVRGTTGLPNYVREPYGPGWSLVGDAGYHRDPITGHGITDAFRDAELLADALTEIFDGARSEHAALAAYRAARDDALAETFRITRELVALPEPTRFVELQIELADALDREAVELASRPEPAGLGAASAA